MSKGQSNDLWMTKTPAQNTHTHTHMPTSTLLSSGHLSARMHTFILSPMAFWDKMHCV